MQQSFFFHIPVSLWRQQLPAPAAIVDAFFNYADIEDAQHLLHNTMHMALKEEYSRNKQKPGTTLTWVQQIEWLALAAHLLHHKPQWQAWLIALAGSLPQPSKQSGPTNRSCCQHNNANAVHPAIGLAGFCKFKSVYNWRIFLHHVTEYAFTNDTITSEVPAAEVFIAYQQLNNLLHAMHTIHQLCRQQPTTANEQPTTANEQPTTANEQPTTVNEQQTLITHNS